MRILVAIVVVLSVCLMGSVALAAQPDQAKPDQVAPDQAKPDQVKPDQAKPDQAKPDQVKPDQCKPDQVKCGKGCASRRSCHAQKPRRYRRFRK
jgi:hypothetical protein